MRIQRMKLILVGIAFCFMLSTTFLHAKLPEKYVDLTADEKLSVLMENIKSSNYLTSHERLPLKSPSLFNMFRILTVYFLEKTFTWTSDEIPPCRPKDTPKLIHTYGSTAAVEWVVEHDLPYTGLFKTGGVGIVRLSIAKMDEPFTPGMGLKVLIDGKPSVNFLVMHSLNGQVNDHNFFRHPFTNVIQSPTDKILSVLEGRFNAAIASLSGGPLDRPERSTNLPLYEAANIDRFGKEQGAGAIEPYSIIFTPNPTVTARYNVDVDYRTSLAEIPAGTTLYQISVQKTKDSPMEPLGSLVTRSEFTASAYGDRVLFFQHQTHQNPAKSQK